MLFLSPQPAPTILAAALDARLRGHDDDIAAALSERSPGSKPRACSTRVRHRGNQHLEEALGHVTAEFTQRVDLLPRPGVVLLLAVEHREVAMRAGIVGIGGEDLVVEPGRLVEPAFVLQLHRLIEEFAVLARAGVDGADIANDDLARLGGRRPGKA